MTKEQIMLKMEKLYSRIELYVKKSKTMGLDKAEEDKYYSLFGEYIQLKLRLADIVFDQCILSALTYGDAAKLQSEMFKTIKWSTELMIEDEQMEPVIQEYTNLKNKKDINNKIEAYYVELMTNLEKYMDDRKNYDMIREVGKIISDEREEDPKESLRSHVDYKFEVLYMILAEGECDEETC